MSTVSLRDRLKQYQDLKENSQRKAYVPPNRQQELDFVAKRSPMQTSLRKLEAGSSSRQLPGSPDLDNEESEENDNYMDIGYIVRVSMRGTTYQFILNRRGTWS